jgi:hypothetical protein
MTSQRPALSPQGERDGVRSAIVGATAARMGLTPHPLLPSPSEGRGDGGEGADMIRENVQKLLAELPPGVLLVARGQGPLSPRDFRSH